MKFKVDIQELKDDPPPKKNNNGLVLVLVSLLAFFCCLKILPYCGWGDQFGSERDIYNPQFNTGYYFYDTDKGYDQTIKKNLSPSQMAIFDYVLKVEAANGGIPLEIRHVKKLVNYDQHIVDAYYRWLRIKRLYRSDGHVVYPDDRDAYPASHLRVEAFQ